MNVALACNWLSLPTHTGLGVPVTELIAGEGFTTTVVLLDAEVQPSRVAVTL